MIGPSGAGKSTLAQVLLGLRAPTGSVTVGGTELSQVDRCWWTRRVSFVPQDPVLFTGTITENIRFFRDDIDDEDLRRAAGAANVLTEILAMPQGFETHLGQRGGVCQAASDSGSPSPAHWQAGGTADPRRAHVRT